MKIRKGNIVYYINDQFYNPKLTDTELYRMSDYVINLESNTILKCRQDLESLFDSLFYKKQQERLF